MLKQQDQYAMRGFTLVELLISVAIGMTVMAGLLSIYLNTSRSSTDTLRIARLNHDLRTMAELIISDIRRAGYSAGAQADIDSNTNTNPFMDASSGWDLTINGPSDCILYSYDSNSNGLLSTASPDERFGFRLNGANKTIEMRIGGADFACDSGTWEEIMDSKLVEITALSFTETPTLIDLDNDVSTTPQIAIRKITVALTGGLYDDVTVTRTFTESVRIRNDKYSP
jgi:type IV pilus assembly protein PilW